LAATSVNSSLVRLLTPTILRCLRRLLLLCDVCWRSASASQTSFTLLLMSKRRNALYSRPEIPIVDLAHRTLCSRSLTKSSKSIQQWPHLGHTCLPTIYLNASDIFSETAQRLCRSGEQPAVSVLRARLIYAKQTL
jgi:hypothetical protein